MFPRRFLGICLPSSAALTCTHSRHRFGQVGESAGHIASVQSKQACERCKLTVSAVAESWYCISAWKPACFSKVAILHTNPKAEKTR